ncbi:hypothetical protein cypCar_00005612 [Cyprinus carpio]|nr:hypothetical protein cypCar_00005612 [Cyprinus carpio]
MSTQASTSGSVRRSAEDSKTHFRVCRFIIETGICNFSEMFRDFFNCQNRVKLGMRSVPMATACVLYHRFFQSASLQVYEPYLVAMSAIYLAGKVEEQHLRTRDIINVCHRYFHPESEPLELAGKFWELRDSIVQLCQGCNTALKWHHYLMLFKPVFFFFILCFAPSNKLHFAVSQYLLQYLLSVRSLLNRHAWSRTPIAETALAVLKDSYHGSVCVRHKPQHLALTSLCLALQTYGVQLPRGELEWWQVVCADITKTQIETIMSELLQLYDMEAKCT